MGQNLDLRFPAFRTIRNEFLFKLLRICLLQQPKPTKAHTCLTLYQTVYVHCL